MRLSLTGQRKTRKSKTLYFFNHALYLFTEPFGTENKYNTQEVITMSELERIDKLFLHGYITAEQWEMQREFYEERLYKLYLEGKITLEELCERLDK